MSDSILVDLDIERQRRARDFDVANEGLPSERDIPDSGGKPPGGSDMERRVERLEDAVLRIDANIGKLATGLDTVGLSQGRVEERMGRVDERNDGLQSDISAVRLSQVRIEERMERVMDRARDMPSAGVVDTMITSKLGLSAALMTALGVLIAAVAYAAG